MAEITIHSAKSIATQSFSILAELRNLRGALIRMGFEEDADDLAECMRSFWLYSLFDTAVVMTVAGPQGVGKSLLTNTLLELSEPESLPVGEGSCEHIPVILRPTPPNKGSGYVEVYSTGTDGQGELFTRTELLYDEGRRRALTPHPGDRIIFWYIKDNPVLRRLSPLVVLPGLELGASWEESIRYTLGISDIVLYVVDASRKAQASAETLSAWIKEGDLLSPPIGIVTKADMMSPGQMDGMRETMGAYIPEFVGQDPQTSPQEFETLGQRIALELSRVPPARKNRKYRTLVRATKRTISSAKDKIVEAQARDDLQEMVVVDRTLRSLDKFWTDKFRPRLVGALENGLAERRERASKSGTAHRKHITEGVLNKIGLLFTGGPSMDNVIEIEDAIRNEYAKELKKEITSLISTELKGRLATAADGEPVEAIGSLMGIMMLTPVKSIQTDTEQLISSLKEAGEVSKETAEYVKSVSNAAGDVLKDISKLRSAFGKKAGGQMALGGTLATAGTATAAAELAGGGLAGVSASVLAGVTGAAVAAVAVAGLASIVIRNSRQLEWDLHNYIRHYSAELEQETQTQFKKQLDAFWTLMQYEIRSHISEQIGLNDGDRHILLALSSIKHAKDALDAADELVV